MKYYNYKTISLCDKYNNIGIRYNMFHPYYEKDKNKDRKEYKKNMKEYFKDNCKKHM